MIDPFEVLIALSRKKVSISMKNSLSVSTNIYNLSDFCSHHISGEVSVFYDEDADKYNIYCENEEDIKYLESVFID